VTGSYLYFGTSDLHERSLPVCPVQGAQLLEVAREWIITIVPNKAEKHLAGTDLKECPDVIR